MTESKIYGFHAVTAALKNKHRQIFKLYLAPDRHDQRMNTLIELAKAREVSIHELKTETLATDLQDARHQGVMAEVGELTPYHERDLEYLLSLGKKPCLILILDGVTDPHNLGACLRVADATGVDCVIIPKDKSASLNATVSKVASGGAESVPLIRVTNLARTLDALKKQGIWIFGGSDHVSKSLYDLDFKGSVAIVMGSEGTGMRRLTEAACDERFFIPMQGIVSSLNVSVAAGVCCYEIIRQRMTSI